MISGKLSLARTYAQKLEQDHRKKMWLNGDAKDDDTAPEAPENNNLKNGVVEIPTDPALAALQDSDVQHFDRGGEVEDVTYTPPSEDDHEDDDEDELDETSFKGANPLHFSKGGMVPNFARAVMKSKRGY